MLQLTGVCVMVAADLLAQLSAGEKTLAIATLAAGIIQARRATSLAAIRDAYVDAMFIVDPAFAVDPTPSEEYDAWVEERGFGTALPSAS